MLSPVDDVLDTLAEVGIDRSHLVGASFGADVADVAVEAVEAAGSAPTGRFPAAGPARWITHRRAQTGPARVHRDREGRAGARRPGRCRRGEPNLVGRRPRRGARDVDPTARELVRQMQRRAFEVTAGWDDLQERELDPAALDRLTEIRVSTL